ncbi:hypothetical protein GP486_007881 [Trichoglossum hirsutum]|uniref:ferric-chelate reductase (NADPH) n=1 Tax=Trichoglossum hirsutum TaxID=265104 RepID=A0A9P8IF33_9PEZI|nr:hypothetical protein GP486_007881 [Trichoglossum hirsutum]
MDNMAMGSMVMGDGVPSLFSLQQMYWAVVGTAIGCAAVVNVYEKALCRQRLSAASGSLSTPAKPKGLLPRSCATAAAVVREVAYVSPPPIAVGSVVLRPPPLGRTILVLSNLVTLTVLCFYKLDPRDEWQYEDIAYRAGFIAICQLPLLFLLSAKTSVIGFLTGSSYERLNWLHRWAARCLFFTVIVHMGYWFTSWGKFDYILVKLKTDPMSKTGLGAGVVLLWIVISSLSPIRGWNYEVFVIQHLLSFTAFITMVYLHVPREVRVWVWIPVGLYFFDRFVRLSVVLYNNLSIFHPRQRRAGKCNGLWACKAEFTPLPHDTTRVTIADPPISWEAGQHVFLSCHSIVPLQSHPFTISSLPEDGKMEFLIKAKRGGTDRFFRYAKGSHGLPVARTSSSSSSQASRKSIAIEGPYGRIRPLQQFDTVILLAGSTGASFTMPLMRDIVGRWSGGGRTQRSGVLRLFGRSQGVVTRKVRFVWVVKGRSQVDYFACEIEKVIADVKELRGNRQDGTEVDISVYVTCDESFTGEQSSDSPGISSVFSQEHGKVEDLGLTGSDDEKKMPPPQSNDVRVKVQENTKEVAGVKPVNCCCTNVLEDENAIVPACNCETCSIPTPTPPKDHDPEKPASSPPRSTTTITTTPSSSSTTASVQGGQNGSPPPRAIRILSGRPECRNLIQRELELARGESAVVVCGPSSLVDAVKDAVVSLSDERAVHKGSGAQGVRSRTCIHATNSSPSSPRFVMLS